MKFTSFLTVLSLASFSLTAPVDINADVLLKRQALTLDIDGSSLAINGGDVGLGAPGTLAHQVSAPVEGEAPDVLAVVPHLPVIGGTSIPAGTLVRRNDAAVDITLGANIDGTGSSLGSIPVHVNHRRTGLDLGTTAHSDGTTDVTADIDATLLRRQVQTADSVLGPVESRVQVLVAQLSSKTVTIDEAKALVPELIAHLGQLQSKLRALSGVKGDVKSLAIRIKVLIAAILGALDNVTVVLAAEITILKPLIIGVGLAIQGVLDVADGIVGLSAQLAIVLKPLVVILVKLGIHLHIGLPTV